MKQYVVDTHALYWYLTDSPRLGQGARVVFDDALAGAAVLVVPAIVLAELFFLNEKVGRPVDFVETFERLRESSQFRLHGFQPEEVLDFDADSAVPEMHDRMIVGTARRLGAACISRDAAIVSYSAVETVW